MPNTREKPNALPTKAEIAAECMVIKEGWSAREEMDHRQGQAAKGEVRLARTKQSSQLGNL